MSGTGIIYMDSEHGEDTRALFGRTHPATAEWLSNSVSRYAQNLGGQATHFVDDIYSRFKEINSITITNRVENFRNRLNSLWQVDAIRPLTNINDIQQAPQSMHRWVMAHPQIRRSWNREGCSGFDGKYVDVRPGGAGVEHYDYRRVMHGVVVEEKYQNFHEPILDERDLLTILEKNNILNTWRVIDGLLGEGNTDPTDPWSGGVIV